MTLIFGHNTELNEICQGSINLEPRKVFCSSEKCKMAPTTQRQEVKADKKGTRDADTSYKPLTKRFSYLRIKTWALKLGSLWVIVVFLVLFGIQSSCTYTFFSFLTLTHILTVLGTQYGVHVSAGPEVLKQNSLPEECSRQWQQKSQWEDPKEKIEPKEKACCSLFRPSCLPRLLLDQILENNCVCLVRETLNHLWNLLLPFKQSEMKCNIKQIIEVEHALKVL